MTPKRMHLGAALSATLLLGYTGVGSAQQPAPARPASTPATPNAAEAPVRDLLRAFAAAYTKADAKALTALFADDASLVDSAGGETRGRDAIGTMYADSLGQVPGLKLDSDVKEVRFVTPDVARVDGRSRLATGTGDATEYTRFHALVVRSGGKWLISELRDYPAPPEDVAPYERLRELEWMVGEWVDESENAKINATVKWGDNKSILIRTYSVNIRGEQPKTGIMIIGWDPSTGQIKSWVFDSEGGNGEGLWTRTGEHEWVVKAQGVLRDGRPTSATQIHTMLNKDSAKASSIDRIIGGQIAPDIEGVIMVRKAPAPGTGAPAAAPPAR